MHNHERQLLDKGTLIMTIVLFVFVIVLLALYLEQHGKINNRGSGINQTVLSYQPLVEKYANDNGVSEYTDILLAMMMQESSGRGSDPMQASESYCGKVGCINDPEVSIRQGVKYFARTLNDAGGDLKLAIQSYNFGHGFIQYVQNSSGRYTQEVAIRFSRQMYENAEDPSIYTCMRDGAKKYNACYGDIYYVWDVLSYEKALTSKNKG